LFVIVEIAELAFLLFGIVRDTVGFTDKYHCGLLLDRRRLVHRLTLFSYI
jgi:hypothetical protein